MRDAKPWPVLVLMFALCSGSAVSRADQIGGAATVPDMLVAMLANAKVSLAPESLIHALATHADPAIRGFAAEALGLLGERSAESALLQALATDSDRQVREASALALARIGNATGLKTLKGLLRTSDSSVRQLTLAAQLADLGEPEGFPSVAEAAASKNASTRSLAAQFLASFVPLAGLTADSGQSPGEILLGLADDPSPEVRLTVVRGLAVAVQKGLDQASAKVTVQRLAVHDVDPSVRESAKSLLDGWRFDDEERARRKAGA